MTDIFLCYDFDMKVLVIIPTYNEKENIRKIIKAIFDIDSRHHILVIDDNSPDKTWRVVGGLQRKNRNLHLILREFKEGIGPAYISGFKFALKNDYDYVLQMDADLSHNPEAIPIMVSLMGKKSWVIGSRYVKGGNIKGWERKRKFLSWFGNWYARLILGYKIKDWTSGFNLWPISFIKKLSLAPDQFPNGYAFQIALKWQALKMGYEPLEIPITFRDRHRGRTKIAGGIINEAAVTVLRLRISNHRPKK